MQILPGLYQLNGAPYGAAINSFLVQRDGATILIDSGDFDVQEYLPRIARNAARWGLSLDEVSHLFVTHEHFDHASHAAALQRRGIRVVASPDSADAMAAADMRCIGWAHPDRTFEPCAADRVIHDDEQVTVGDLSVRCIAAPGHCDGAVVYELVLDGEVCWFVGDLMHVTDALSPECGQPKLDGGARFRQSEERRDVEAALRPRLRQHLPRAWPPGPGLCAPRARERARQRTRPMALATCAAGPRARPATARVDVAPAAVAGVDFDSERFARGAGGAARHRAGARLPVRACASAARAVARRLAR